MNPLSDYPSEWEVRLLREMCEIYSPSGHEDELASFLVATVQALGWHSYRDPAGNFVAETEIRCTQEAPEPPAQSVKTLVFLGHIDTVPGYISVRHENGLLFGRGSVDAKGPLAAFIAALRRVAVDVQVVSRKGLPPGAGSQASGSLRVIIIGAVGEESDSRGAYYAVGQYAPDCCIIGEPSGWSRVTTGYKGSLALDACVTGAAGHSAGPERSVAEQGVALWNSLSAYCRSVSGQQSLFNSLEPSLRSFRTESDGIEERAMLRCVLRLPPGSDAERLKESLREIFGTADIRISPHQEPFKASKNSSLVKAFLAAIRGESGDPRFKLKTGTSDMNIVGPAWGCPILAYGPGDSKLDHSPSEHVSMWEYAKAINVLARVLSKTAGRPL